ncbi:MAG: DNA-processing protein DprA [Candidatus Kapaibacteriales bacterium]
MLQTQDILTIEFSKILPSNKVRQIIEKFNSLDEAISFILKQKNLPINESGISLNEKIKRGEQLAQEQIEKAQKQGVKIITYWDNEYPKLLREINYPPITIFVKGELKSNDVISISIVGTRKYTTYGKLVTEQFAQTFARYNIIVTSGMAYGIDTIAHLSTINANGTTYAIIASGLDCISPQQAKKVSEEILKKGGAIITEHMFGTPARNIFFPQRNRIISGISLATIIIESDIKGGAMITARFAFDQNREVFAVPGNITSPKSRGTNYLIKNFQAKIATDPYDVLYELGIIKDNFPFEEEKMNEPADDIDKIICNNISFEPKHIDILATELKMDIQELLVRLLNLEFSGFVKQLPGKFFVRSR